MKKLISYILTITILFSALAAMNTAGAAALELSMESVTAEPGDTVDIQVNITNNPGFSLILFSLKYDTDALTLTKTTNGNIFDSCTVGKNILFVTANDTTATGTLITLTFAISKSAALKDYELNMIVRECYNDKEATVATNSANGKITVYKEPEPSIIPGDLNNDQKVTTADIITLARHIVKNIALTPEQLTAADYNKDNIINTKDLVSIARKVVSE